MTWGVTWEGLRVAGPRDRQRPLPCSPCPSPGQTGPQGAPPRLCGPAPEVSHLRGTVFDPLCFTEASCHAASHEQPREGPVLSIFKPTKLRVKLSSELSRAIEPRVVGLGWRLRPWHLLPCRGGGVAGTPSWWGGWDPPFSPILGRWQVGGVIHSHQAGHNCPPNYLWPFLMLGTQDMEVKDERAWEFSLRQGAGHSGHSPPKAPAQHWSQSFSILAYGTGAQMPPIPGGRSRHGNQCAVPQVGPTELGAGL